AVEELDRAVKIAGRGAIACNQVLYHLEERAIEHEVLPWCEQHRVALVGYSPFGSGHFPSPRTRGGRVLEEIAAAHQATSRQVALTFLTRRESLFTIPKSSRIEHVEENAGAGAIHLTAGEIERIDRAFPRGPRRHGVPML